MRSFSEEWFLLTLLTVRNTKFQLEVSENKDAIIFPIQFHRYPEMSP